MRSDLKLGENWVTWWVNQCLLSNDRPDLRLHHLGEEVPLIGQVALTAFEWAAK